EGDPRRRRAEGGAPGEAGATGHVDESSFAVVVEQTALSDGSDEHILVAIVVVVGGRDAHSVDRHVQAGAGGDVFEPAAAVVAKDASGGLIRPRAVRPASAIGDNHILPAVVVDVHE